MRNKSWWSAPTDWETVCKRNRGRARHNALKQFSATMRRRQVVDLLAQWGWKPGVQSLLATHLGVHRSTICRDLQRIFPLLKECSTCGGLTPRSWWREG